jgi:hypothetical protein
MGDRLRATDGAGTAAVGARDRHGASLREPRHHAGRTARIAHRPGAGCDGAPFRAP